MDKENGSTAISGGIPGMPSWSEFLKEMEKEAPVESVIDAISLDQPFPPCFNISLSMYLSLLYLQSFRFSKMAFLTRSSAPLLKSAPRKLVEPLLPL